MYLVDPNDHILKISCHYLHFWLRYKDFFFVTDRRTDGWTDGRTLINFNIDCLESIESTVENLLKNITAAVDGNIKLKLCNDKIGTAE